MHVRLVSHHGCLAAAASSQPRHSLDATETTAFSARLSLAVSCLLDPQPPATRTTIIQGGNCFSFRFLRIPSHFTRKVHRRAPRRQAPRLPSPEHRSFIKDEQRRYRVPKLGSTANPTFSDEWARLSCSSSQRPCLTNRCYCARSPSGCYCAPDVPDSDTCPTELPAACK